MDQTQQVRQRAWDEKPELFHDMLDESHDMIFIIRINNGFIDYVNKTAESTLGYTLEEMRHGGIETFRRPLKAGEPFFEHLQELKNKEMMTDYAILIKKDGSEFPIEANVKYIKRNGIDYNIAIVRDITERVEMERRLQKLNQNLEVAVLEKTVELQKNFAFLEGHKLALDAGNIVSKSDPAGIITYVNDSFCSTTGYTKEEVIGQPHSIVRHPDTQKRVFKKMWATIQAGKIWHGTIKNRKKNGGHYWVDITILPILDEKGEIFEYIAVRHNVTELVEQRQILEQIAKTDALTGLGNRFKLINDIQASRHASLALINLDNFREINDFYGHGFGDLLIMEVANSIEKMIQNHSAKKLYRLQADEFAILNLSLSQKEFVRKIEAIIQHVASTTYTINEEGISVQMTGSISFDSDKNNLFTSADMTMKSAKKRQQNILVYHEDLALDAEYENNISWTKKLQTAIRNDRLVPFFQPIVNNLTGKWEKYESLVRMIDEDGSVITPFFFLEIAKRTKYYKSLTKTVVHKTFETCLINSDKEFALNLTINDIMEKETRAYIFEMLEKYRVGERIVFEIVESEEIENYDEVIDFIKNAKACGCKIAIDDFGSGYSNFNYLLRLKADYIKIDGSLIQNLETDENAKVLVSTIVSFAKKLGIKTIAEFVKDEKIQMIVQEMGIDYSQGYHFSPPKSTIDD